MGEKLRKLRLLKGVEVDYAAQKIGISKARWLAIEWGKEEPSWPLLHSMCQALSVTELEFNAYFCSSISRDRKERLAEM